MGLDFPILAFFAGKIKGQSKIKSKKPAPRRRWFTHSLLQRCFVCD